MLLKTLHRTAQISLTKKIVRGGLGLAFAATLGLAGCVSNPPRQVSGNAGVRVPETIAIADDDIYPESIARSRNGDIIIGSLAQHFIYRATAGEAVARRWIDLSSVNSISYGVLADDDSATLWACTVVNPNTGTRPPPLAQRVSALRAFDLKTGRPKGVFALPGVSNACNDIAIAPDGDPYVSDLGNGRILRLRRNNGTFEVVYAGPEMYRVDGLAFLGKFLFATGLETGLIHRLDPTMHPVSVQLLRLSKPLARPDGMRAHRGRLFIADNGLGEILELTVRGDEGQLETLIGDLERPTGVTPGAQRIWFVESKSNYWDGRGKNIDGPNPFRARSFQNTRLQLK